MSVAGEVSSGAAGLVLVVWWPLISPEAILRYGVRSAHDIGLERAAARLGLYLEVPWLGLTLGLGVAGAAVGWIRRTAPKEAIQEFVDQVSRVPVPPRRARTDR